MDPEQTNPLDRFFKEGLRARRDGQTLHDNPYSAGSPERREWRAGFCATVQGDDDMDQGNMTLGTTDSAGRDAPE